MRSLEELRDAVDAVDARIVAAIAERVRLAREAGEVKRAAGLPVLDPGRERAVVDRAAERALADGVPEPEMRALYWRLLALMRRAQLG